MVIVKMSKLSCLSKGTRVHFTHKNQFRSGEVLEVGKFRVRVNTGGKVVSIREEKLIGYWPEGVKPGPDNLVRFEEV